MQQQFITKLFYRQYAYKIVIQDILNKNNLGLHWLAPKRLRKWFFEKDIPHKLIWRTDWDRYFKGEDSKATVHLYLENEQHCDMAITEYHKHVIAVAKPYHVSHIDLLKANASIRIQSRLIYGKYRYVVIFKQYLTKEAKDNLIYWIENSLDLENTNAIKCDIKGIAGYLSFYYSPRLYLRDESDLIMVKMACRDEIQQITVILLNSEVETIDTQ